MFWGTDNARKIQGKAVQPAAPADGQVLVWSAANNRWELQGAALADHAITAAKLARQTAGLIPIGQGAGADVAWNALSGDATLAASGALALDPVFFRRFSVTVSASEIANLRATPKTLIAAPGTGKLIVPVALSAWLQFNSIAFTGSNTTYIGFWTAGPGFFGPMGNGLTGLNLTTLIAATESSVVFAQNVVMPTTALASYGDIRNKPLILQNVGAAEFGGGGNSQLHIHGWYAVVASPF